MPMYYYLRQMIKKADDRQRAARNLLKLRKQLDKAVPPKDADETLLLATWNIRDFGKKGTRRGWGRRLPETWFYIAEVLSRFDFVAIQEVNQIRPEWDNVMKILGRGDYDYIATDETDKAIGGNGERMTFVYDRRKVNHQSIAGEIVLPPKMMISSAELELDDGSTVVAGNQFKRTPFMASFQSGWLKFDICTVHLYYGSSSGHKLQQRVEEIATIADYLGSRADRALGEDRALFVLGDFNIVSPEHKTMKALLDNGFSVPKALVKKPTTGTAKHYDQIGFKTKPHVMEYAEKPGNAGVVHLYKSIMRNSDWEMYADDVRTMCTKGRNAQDDEELRKAYREWRTYQFSDHYPMWVRLDIDRSEAYLKGWAAGTPS